MHTRNLKRPHPPQADGGLKLETTRPEIYVATGNVLELETSLKNFVGDGEQRAA